MKKATGLFITTSLFLTTAFAQVNLKIIKQCGHLADTSSKVCSIEKAESIRLSNISKSNPTELNIQNALQGLSSLAECSFLFEDECVNAISQE